MVWFQCEDCGEDLKKPKLANHFRMCSAHKVCNSGEITAISPLSCIDCGQMFDQQSVQSHTQCISEAHPFEFEARLLMCHRGLVSFRDSLITRRWITWVLAWWQEKYGPKGQGNVSQNGQTNPDKPKKNSDVDINVGLSSRAPWFCSLCNAQATSKQTLLLHADGKKHRAKARAFHAAQKQSNQTEETPSEKDAVGNVQKESSVEANGSNNKVQEIHLQKDSDLPVTGGEKESHTKKRKVEASENGLSKRSKEKNASDLTNGEVIQAEKSEASQQKSKKKKGVDESFNCKDQADKQGTVVEASHSKPKWKKIITSTLKLSGGVMKIKKLQKLVLEALKESGITEDEEKLRDKLMHKISSSTRFTIESKHIRLVAKTEES